ncbi:response regulator [Paenibacillus sedimenti]|uniref:Response regulator n=1 Tax=Paenibacillus sedimenti TaxID=2770274 RepID=A0A926KS88_9BACL|nr:response regulator [Paenibacillus sedimenti]
MALKILIVDDTQFMRKMLADCLKQNGFEVAGEASNGREAIRQYEELQPDVVMMDINMPEMGGIEAIKEILKLDADAVILVCTAANQQESILEAIEVGAKGYVMKPFKTNQVLEIIRKNTEPSMSLKGEAAVSTGTAELIADTSPEVAMEPNREEAMDAQNSEKPLLEAASVSESVMQEGQNSVEHAAPSNACENTIALNSPRGNGNLKSFVSSIMCNWQEEINGETATFTVVCTESENKLLIEMNGDNQVKHTMHFTIDGLRQLSGWLEDHIGRKAAV